MKLPEYQDYLRSQPCVCCGLRQCNPHHTGSHGTAKRLHDEDSCSLCFSCHRLYHDGLATWTSKAGLQRKAEEQFAQWKKTLDPKKRKKIEEQLNGQQR